MTRTLFDFYRPVWYPERRRTPIWGRRSHGSEKTAEDRRSGRRVRAGRRRGHGLSDRAGQGDEGAEAALPGAQHRPPGAPPRGPLRSGELAAGIRRGGGGGLRHRAGRPPDGGRAARGVPRRRPPAHVRRAGEAGGPDLRRAEEVPPCRDAGAHSPARRGALACRRARADHPGAQARTEQPPALRARLRDDLRLRGRSVRGEL